MAEQLNIAQGNKEEKYATLFPQIQSVIEDEPDLIARMANVAAMLHETFRFWWAGFYRVVDTPKQPNDQTTKQPNDQTTNNWYLVHFKGHWLAPAFVEGVGCVARHGTRTQRKWCLMSTCSLVT